MNETAAPTLTTDVVVLAPTGRDPLLAQHLLEAAEFRVKIANDIQALCDAITERNGVLLIAEEALHCTGQLALARKNNYRDIGPCRLTG